MWPQDGQVCVLVAEGVLAFPEGTSSEVVVQGHQATGPQLGILSAGVTGWGHDNNPGHRHPPSCWRQFSEAVSQNPRVGRERRGSWLQDCAYDSSVRSLSEDLGFHPDNLRRKVLSGKGLESPPFEPRPRGSGPGSTYHAGPACSLLARPCSDRAQSLETLQVWLAFQLALPTFLPSVWQPRPSSTHPVSFPHSWFSVIRYLP